jgi:hypothetical protein
LIDDNPGDAIRPAGLRNGVAGPAAADWTATASDVRALIAAVAPATRVGLMVSAAERAELVSVYDPEDGNLVIMPGAAVPAGMVIAVDLDCFTSCTALPQFEISTEASCTRPPTRWCCRRPVRRTRSRRRSDRCGTPMWSASGRYGF